MAGEGQQFHVEVIGTEQVVARLNALPATLKGSLQILMEKLTVDMQATIKRDKLSGQVLNRRSGRLSNAINREVEVTDTSVAGMVFVGKEAPYGAIHEYGRTVNVPAHRRVVSKVFGVSVEPFEQEVRAHTAVYPERSFMRTTLAEYRGRFVDGVRKSMAEVLK
jgi:phage gpG-like protein